jgi:flagellin
MRINNNLMALNTHRQLSIGNSASAKSMEKLSSGLRINRAGDDAAGLSISEKMRGQIRGLTQAARNAQDGISLIQTAEGALSETHAILQRQRELVVQAGNAGTLETEDLQAIQDELTQLNSELDGIADRTEFNGKKLLDGNFSYDFQIGANIGQQHTLTINSGVASEGFTAEKLTVNTIDVTDAAFDFDAEITKVDAAIGKVSSARSNLGANQNRLEHTIKNLDNAAENLQAAESRVRDVDYAEAA